VSFVLRWAVVAGQKNGRSTWLLCADKGHALLTATKQIASREYTSGMCGVLVCMGKPSRPLLQLKVQMLSATS
jgi:hypothetical protein